ncbi:hypothetical protein [Streptomyces sp. NPDC055400]
MTGRSGPFWDGVEGRAPLPRVAATLGLEVLDADGDNGAVEPAFTATEDFTNPAGNVLGAFLVLGSATDAEDVLQESHLRWRDVDQASAGHHPHLRQHPRRRQHRADPARPRR